MPVHPRVRRTALTMIAVVLAALGYAPPAHAAGWQMSDGFETRPADTWACWHTVDDPTFVNGCRIGFASPRPHGGSSTSWIQATSGWSDIGRSVTLTPFLNGRTLRCGARMWGRTLSPNDQLRGQLEVIDVHTWTYLSIQPFSFTRAGDFLVWRAITTSTWIPAHREVYVRIGLIGEDRSELDALEVDDLTVSCQYY